MSDSLPASKPLWRRLWPLALIAAGFIAAWQAGVFNYLSLDTLREQQGAMKAFVAEHFWLALGGFILLYAAATLFMFPAALWITIAGGFLFGLATGSAATAIGATLGATLLFLSARSSLGEGLRQMAGKHVENVRGEFQKNPLSYMFAMRFAPVVPFAISNILPAVLGAKLRDYVLATAIGILPGVIAYTWIGAGLSATFARGEDPDLASVFANLAPAGAALAVVSLIPVVWKKLAARRATAGN